MTTACARYVISALVVVAFGKFCNYCYYRPEVYFQVKTALCVDFEQCNYCIIPALPVNCQFIWMACAFGMSATQPILG